MTSKNSQMDSVAGKKAGQRAAHSLQKLFGLPVKTKEENLGEDYPTSTLSKSTASTNSFPTSTTENINTAKFLYSTCPYKDAKTCGIKNLCMECSESV